MNDGTEESVRSCSRWELAAYLVRERRLGVAMLGGGLLFFVIAGLGWNPMPCPFLQVTGLPCPGCGMTRSCLALLRWDFPEVWRMNPFGPVFAAFWATVGIGVALPQPWRSRFAEHLGRIGLATLAVGRIGSLVCWIMVLIKMFQNEKPLIGILGIFCGRGWMKSSTLGLKKIMLIWSACFVLSIIGNVLYGVGMAAKIQSGEFQPTPAPASY